MAKHTLRFWMIGRPEAEADAAYHQSSRSSAAG